LSKSLHDSDMVATEMFLAWIAVALTVLVVAAILDIVLR
jgi:hypothetical protein